MDTEDMVIAGVTAGVFFILLSVLVIPNFSQTQGEISQIIQDVNSEADWKDVINTSASSNYNITADGTVDIKGSSGLVQTKIVDTEKYDRIELYAEQAQGDTTVTIYNSSDQSIGSATISGSGNTTIKVDNYNADKIYVEFDATGTSDSHVELYESTGFRKVKNSVSNLIYIVLLLFMVAIALAMWERFK